MQMMPNLRQKASYAIKEAKPYAKVQSLVSSAKRLTTGTARRQSRSTQTIQDWQTEAWNLYDLVAELRYLATTLARQQAMAKFYVVESPEDAPTEEPQPTENPKVADLLNIIPGHPSIFPQMIERIAVNLFVAGEAWLIGLPPEDSLSTAKDLPMDSLDWGVYSSSEIVANVSGNSIKVRLSEDDERDYSIDEVHAIRIWNGHPREAWSATSPCQAALPVLQQIVGLTSHTSAQIDSRLAGAGVLLVPATAQATFKAGSDDDTDNDVFLDSLVEAMMTPISDRSSASAVVPLTVPVPDETADKFRYMSFDKPLDAAAAAMMDQALRRFALGQDAPPELLLGTASVNHWGAWIVKEETIRSHVAPAVSLICDALTRGFLWPILLQKGMEEETAARFSVGYSVDHLIVRPSAGDDAKELYDRGLLTPQALRRETGFDEGDAPVNDAQAPAHLQPPTSNDEERSEGGRPRSVGDPDLSEK